MEIKRFALENLETLLCLIKSLFPGMIYGQQNKLEMLNRVCGSPKDPQYKESCECGDLGVEGQLHKSNVSISKKCGYSLRLWFYPCSGTDPQKVGKLRRGDVYQ